MRPRSDARLVFPFLVLAVGATAVALGQTPAPTRPRTLIAGARILDAAAGVYLPPSFVLVEGDRITSVDTKRPASLLEDTETVDASGLTIVPGLIDAHAQVSPTDDLDADYFALMNLAHGVTSVRGINVRTAWGVSQRQRLAAGRSLGPRLFTSGRGLDAAARSDLWLFDVSSPAVATDEARHQASAGVDWVVGYGHLPVELYRALVAAVSGTATRVAAHPGAASLNELAAAGVRSIETVDYPLAGRPSAPPPASTDPRWPALTARDAAALARTLVKGDITLVPLLARALVQAYPQDVAADPDLAKLPDARRAGVLDTTKAVRWPEIAARRKDWTARSQFLQRFIQAGGRVAAGTGFEETGYPVPGAGLHTELQAMVRAGMAPADVIRAATTNGAALVGASDRLGAVKPGMAGDLILVEGDPLASVGDLSKIRHVMHAGEMLDPKTLADAAARASKGIR